MSGACRETYNLRINPRVLWRWRTWKYSKRLLFEDNLMWLACAVLGHRAYNTSTIYEKPEHACSRCHRWLRHLDPDEWQHVAVHRDNPDVWELVRRERGPSCPDEHVYATDDVETVLMACADALAPPTDTEAYIRELVDEIRRLKAALDAAQSLTQRMERQHVAIHLDAAGRATTVWECVRCEIRPSCTERHVYLDSDVDALRACADALAPQRKACPECKHPWHDSYCPVPTSPSEIAAFPHTCGCLAHEDRADALAPPEPQGQVVWLIERVQAMQINGKATYWSGDEELPPGGETTDPWDACWFPRKQDAARVAVGRFGKNLARSGWQIVEHVFSAPPEPKPEKKQWDVDQMCEEHALTDCRWCFGGLPAPPRADALDASRTDTGTMA